MANSLNPAWLDEELKRMGAAQAGSLPPPPDPIPQFQGDLTQLARSQGVSFDPDEIARKAGASGGVTVAPGVLAPTQAASAPTTLTPAMTPAPAAAPRQQQQAPMAPQMGGGGMGFKPATLEGLQILDDITAKAESDYQTRLRRAEAFTDPSQRRAVETAARVERDRILKGADERRKKHLQTSAGMGEQIMRSQGEGARSAVALTGELAGIDQAGSEQSAARAERERLLQRGADAQHQRKVSEIGEAVERAESDYNATRQEWRDMAAKQAEGGPPLGVGQSILGGLGLALAAVATGLTGKNFDVLPMIDRMIERKLRQDEAALQNKRMAMGDSLNLVAMMRDKFGDEDMAYQAAKAGYREQFALELGALSDTTAAKRNSAIYKQNLAEVTRMADEEKMQFRKMAVDLRDAKNTLMAGEAARRQQGKIDAARREADPLLRRGGIQRVAKDDDFARHVPRAGGFAADKDSARGVRDMLGRSDRLLDNIGELRRLVATGRLSLSDAEARYQAITSQVQALNNVDLGQGAISKDDATRVERAIPTGEDLMEPRAAARLEAVEAEIRNARERVLQNTIRPGAIRPGQDERGKEIWHVVEVPLSDEQQQQSEQMTIDRSEGR